jgi:hypothetical protein
MRELRNRFTSLIRPSVLVTVAAVVLLLAGGGAALAQPQPCGTTTWDLTAGQHNKVGTVVVSNDMNNIYITFMLDPTLTTSTLGMLHVWVGNNLLNLPVNGQGIPVPGQFCQAAGGACHDATGLTTYTFTIPFGSLNIVDATAGCGSSLYVFAHAEVGSETAWGGPIGVNIETPGRWYFYGQYTICCDFGQPPTLCNQTAFAKGGWVWTTDRKSNPENLPSLNLIKNRWGWAINLAGPGTTTYDIWAGAGLNKTASGTLVGTLTVNWDGSTAAVTYTMFSGFLIQEVHLYAQDGAPTTTAPGQFGYLDSFDPTGIVTYTFTVPLADTNGTGGVWLIAHAVVSHPCS